MSKKTTIKAEAYYRYEDVEPTLIENTSMQIRIRTSDGVQTTFLIKPNAGYVLHDNLLDTYPDCDESGNPIGEPILEYYNGTRTIGANYDFAENPRGLYAVLASDVPADQIFG